MLGSDKSLREQITDGDPKLVPVRRRQRVSTSRGVRGQLGLLGGLVAALAGLGMALSIAILTGPSTPDAVVRPGETASGAETVDEMAYATDEAARDAAAETAAHIAASGVAEDAADGASAAAGAATEPLTGPLPTLAASTVAAEPRVERAMPVGLASASTDPSAGGQAQPHGAEPVPGPVAPVMSVRPIRGATDIVPRGPRAIGPAGPGRPTTLAAAPATAPQPSPLADRDGTVAAAMVVARSNLLWKRLLEAEGLDYTPVARAPLSRWGEGACAIRPEPEVATYCTLDATVYANDAIDGEPVALLDIARQIGLHVQETLGVMIAPASGPERLLRSDCFAGLWARQDAMVGDGLAPGYLAQAFNADGTESIAEGERLAAFTAGYSAERPLDCETAGSVELPSRS